MVRSVFERAWLAPINQTLKRLRFRYRGSDSVAVVVVLSTMTERTQGQTKGRVIPRNGKRICGENGELSSYEEAGYFVTSKSLNKALCCITALLPK